MRLTLTLLSLLGLCSPGLRAQSDGPLVAPPAFILVGPSTESSSGTLATDVFHRKTAGFKPYGPEVTPVGVLEPIFTTTKLFGGGVAPPTFEVNAYSVGLDIVLATVPVGGLSSVAVPPGAWGAIEFSVTRGTAGAPGSLIEAEVAAPDGAGADLFTLMVPGSFLPAPVFPCYPQDRPQRGQDATEMDLYAGGSQGEIAALDFYTPLYEAGPPVRPLLPDEPTVFFSVSHDAVFPPGPGVSTVPPSWFGGSLPSSATILRTTWMKTAGIWSTPVVHLPYFSLGLDVEDDIDALAVEQGKCLLLFSIAKTATSTLAQQLQIASWPCPDSARGVEPPPGGYTAGVSAGVYVTGGAGSPSVAARTQVGTDGDVDGVCTVDPGEQQPALAISYGSPYNAITPLKSLGSGVYRDSGASGPTLTMTVTGLPIGPLAPPAFAELWAGTPTMGGGYLLFPAPFYSELLDGSVPFDSRDVSFTTPGLAVISGLSVDFFWVVRPSATIIPSSAMLRILL